MKRHAIINKKTKIVQNIISIKENSILDFPLDDDTELVMATRSVQIGMKYDDINGIFPEVYDLDRILDVKYEAQSIADSHKSSLENLNYLTEEQKQIHEEYLSELGSLNKIESYDEIISKFESLKNPPEFPPAPKEITQDVFRKALKLTEKILWDNPETGTEVQKATINTLKMEFPYYGVESMTEELELLEQVGFFTTQRVAEVKQALS